MNSTRARYATLEGQTNGAVRRGAGLAAPIAFALAFTAPLACLAQGTYHPLECPGQFAPPCPSLAAEKQPYPSWQFDLDARARGLWFVGTGSTVAPDTLYGAQRAMAFDVDPILLLGTHLRISRLKPTGWELFGIRAFYETDRVYRSGGSISESDALAQELGVAGPAADIVNGLVAFSGASVEVERARFTSGRAQVQDVATGTVLFDTPLVFTRTKAEVAWNLTQSIGLGEVQGEVDRKQADKTSWTAFGVYYSLTLPRIVYLTRERTVQGEKIDVVVAESAAQYIDVRLLAAGARYRPAFEFGDRMSLALQLALAIGAGQVSFYLPATIGEDDSPSNRVGFDEWTFALVSQVGADGTIRLVGEKTSLYLRLSLLGEQYYAQTSVDGRYGGSIGFSDAFVSGSGRLILRYSL